MAVLDSSAVIVIAGVLLVVVGVAMLALSMPTGGTVAVCLGGALEAIGYVLGRSGTA
jgi:hypothetical protein